MQPKYTVIIPTLNRAYSLWKAIQSVVSQTYPYWQLLVVDGGSTDNTQKLISSMHDPRVKLVDNPDDTGVASARNFGLKYSDTEYVGYLDSDDYVYPNWLEVIDRHIESNTDKVLFMPNKNFVVQQVDDQNKVIRVFKEDILHKEPFSSEKVIQLDTECDTNGMVHRLDAIESVGLWNEELKLYEDFEFLLRFIEIFPDGIHFVPQVLVAYTRTYGKDSLCSTASYKLLVECLEQVHAMHGQKAFLKDQTWYPKLVDKYRERAKEEFETGLTILDHLIEKYSN